MTEGMWLPQPHQVVLSVEGTGVSGGVGFEYGGKKEVKR